MSLSIFLGRPCGQVACPVRYAIMTQMLTVTLLTNADGDYAADDKFERHCDDSDGADDDVVP